MKLEIKIGPISIKHGLNECKVEEITFKAEVSIEEIPVLGNEVKEYSKYFVEAVSKIREVKP